MTCILHGMEALLAALAIVVGQSELTPRRGGMVYYPSPNYNARPAGTVIDTIVLHHTAGTSLISTCKWFAMTESQVSAHYTIGKDGTIVQHVSTYARAWHAGKSRDWQGREGMNDFTIGIEMDNVGDGKDPWTDAQVNAVIRLIKSLKLHRFSTITTITSHEYIAEPRGRKNDPKNFPWDKLEPMAKELGLKMIYKFDNPPKPEVRPGP